MVIPSFSRYKKKYFPKVIDFPFSLLDFFFGFFFYSVVPSQCTSDNVKENRHFYYYFFFSFTIINMTLYIPFTNVFIYFYVG